MRTIVSWVFAFFGLFNGAFSLWTVGNAIRYGVPLSHNWQLLTHTLCPSVTWIVAFKGSWLLCLALNIALYYVVGLIIANLLYQLTTRNQQLETKQ